MTADRRECGFCGREVPLEDIDLFGNNLACPHCRPGADSSPEEPDSSDANPGGSVDSYHSAEFESPDGGVWPPAHADWTRWMNRKGEEKAPFAPWGNADAPIDCAHHDEPTTCAECGHDARFKWGYREHYGDIETAREWAEMNPELADDLVFIQREDDPFAFVDGDDVRDPETGEVHPTFLDTLDRLGLTYTDVSQSGTGAHAMFRGELPDSVKQATWELDTEPWGANEDPPTIEIYDGKHVCVATGDHVPGTPTEVREWDADELEQLLEEHGKLPTHEPGARDAVDLGDYEADATGSGEITADYRDVYAALDRLDAHRVAERTIVDEWKDPSSFDKRAFIPTWAPAGYDGTANFVGRDAWKDSGTRGGKGGPAAMAAIDAGLIADTDAPDAVTGETWVKAVDHLRDLGFDVPLYLPDAEGEDRDEMPYWALRKGAIHLDVTARKDLIERETSAGDTYLGFPDAETYNAALDALEAEGLATGREHVDAGGDPPKPSEYRPDPRDVDVVLDPRRAWDAADRVDAEDLPEDSPLQTEPVGIACPGCGEPVDIVRAVGVREGYIEDCSNPLAEDYADAYTAAREQYGAPLPRYLTTEDAVDEYDLAVGAIRELEFWHLNRDAIECTITGEGDDVDGEAILTLDPSPVDGWRDSDSGESVLVFPSGTVYDADTNPDAEGDDRGMALDALRFVALDAGIIDSPTDHLAGSGFTEAYHVARERYGAPLPRWYAADPNREDPANVPMLPASEELLGEDAAAVAGDTDDLEAARQDVEALVRSLAEGDAADTPTVVESLPATGKSTSAIKQAVDNPTTYLAPRKDLQKQAVEKADEWGVSSHVLPVLGGAEFTDAAVREAVGYVREHGKDELRNRWQLHDAIEAPLRPEDPDDSDDVELQRATCPTADGEHGDAWAMAVLVARELDYSPRDIHTEGAALFGSQPPCTDGGDCPYSEAWDRINDRDAPVDLLVGSYGHAHVEGARTYRTRTENGGRRDEPRALVFDEFPGLAFRSEFGAEAFDHATWLASALEDSVAARTDLEELSLRESGEQTFVGAWLAGDAEDTHDTIADAVDALGRRESALTAAENAETVLSDVDTDRLEQLGAADALQRLVDGWGEETTDPGIRQAIARDLGDAVGDIRPGERNGVKEWISSGVLDELRDSVDGSITVDPPTLPVPEDGPLTDLVEKALTLSRDRDDGALTALRGAREALEGGDDGARELALWADHGYAHPDANHLLRAVLTTTDSSNADRVHTEKFSYDGEGDGTVLKSVQFDGATVLVDENRHGATLLDPPERTAGGGTAPLVGLDATARPELWKLALGEPVDTADIHDSPQERAEFMRDVLGLSVVKMADRARAYEGDPDTKDTDGDVALVEHLRDSYSGAYGGRERGEDSVTVGDPAVITSKGVEGLLKNDDRIADDVAEWGHYGDLDGRNDLGDHTLAALLGSPHYGDGYVEHLAALAGEQPTTDRDDAGYGMALDYGAPVANAALKSMREDRVMQAILRFTRGDGNGALVFARTAALRDDLPVRGEGTIAKTYTENAHRVARAARALGSEFTRADVVDLLEDEHGADAPTERTVRRHLAELASAGYLEREGGGDGRGYQYEHVETPGSGEVAAEVTAVMPPGQTLYEPHYTASVRVAPRDGVLEGWKPMIPPEKHDLPAPTAVADGADPPD